MKIFTVSLAGFQKLVREKVIFSFLFTALFLILVSILFGAMSFDEQNRILVHFGSAGILFSLLGISFIYGANFIRREIESQTILLTLARPIGRSEYFIGQWLALVEVLVLNWLILVFILFALTSFSLPLGSYLCAQFALLLEILLLLSATMFFANFLRPVISFFAGLGLYLIGQATPDLIFFAEKSKNTVFISFAHLAHSIFPQLYRMNLQSYQLILSEKTYEAIIPVTFYGVGWTLFFLVLSLLAFRRKDLV